MAVGIAPNYRSIVERVAAENPKQFRRCGRPDVPFPDNTFFSGLVVLEIYEEADKTGDPIKIAESRRFGCNFKRGIEGDFSKDAIAYQRKAGNLTDVDVIDIVNSSGTMNDDGTLTGDAIANGEAKSSPTWNNQGNVNPGRWANPDLLWNGGPVIQPPPQPTPTTQLPHRGEAMEFGKWLDAYYKSPEGLQRPNGLSIGGRPDWEGVGAWMFDVWLNARLRGFSEEATRALVISEIQKTEEYKEKHR